MLLAFVIVLIITWLAILFSIYSMFTPFVQSFGDIVNYNVAYYGAISAVERWELVLKYRWPWFVWSGWRLEQQVFGKASDTVLNWFSINFADRNWMLWSINSRTNRIPNTWQWNVDQDLAATDSSDYNRLDYKWVETFLLSIDNSTFDSSYNADWTWLEYSGSSISWKFRLPPKILLSGFNGSVLCTWSVEICDPDQDGLYDDIVVDWSLKWFYNWNQFFIMPSESIAYNGDQKVVNNGDTTIRESNVNSWSNINYWDSMNIFNLWSIPETQNVVSNDSSNISGDTFKTIFSNSNYTWLQLKFALVNLLSTVNWNIYPFLEYFFQFDSPVSDRFYTIQWNWRKGDYNVKIIIKKPTFKETVAGSFTVVF